jgi:transcriptional regulator with XRE-family HTH domain
MTTVGNAARVIRRLRQRLDLSQEALAGLLSATKGAVQHWERGRNHPDLARLMALHRLCPDGRERKQLEVLIRQVQVRAAPLAAEDPVWVPRAGRNDPRHGAPLSRRPHGDPPMFRRESDRLQKEVEKLKTLLRTRNEQLRILEDLAEDLQRELVSLRVQQSGKVVPSSNRAPSTVD